MFTLFGRLGDGHDALMVSILAYPWLVFLYPEGSSDIVEIYRNSKGAFDIVAVMYCYRGIG
jgi:hypothetical protein